MTSQLLAVILAVSCVLPSLLVECFIYIPREGSLWDASCFHFNDQYYCFYMYAPPGNGYTSGLLSISSDGVHFVEVGPINYEQRGVGWDKCFVRLLDPEIPLFVMNHGTAGDAYDNTNKTRYGCPTHVGQCLRFLISTNLIDWTELYTHHPDPTYYNIQGRWDHAYMVKTDKGDYRAFPVANSLQGLSPGRMQSYDGVLWNVMPPVPFNWQGVSPQFFEVGGVEKIGNSWYLIGGYINCWGNPGYSMYTMKASDIDGPYSPDLGAFKLTGSREGFIIGLAAWVHDYDNETVKLISDYSNLPNGQTWMLPLRNAVVDQNGHLRMGFWKGNDNLRALPIAIPQQLTIPAQSGFVTTWFPQSSTWDHSTGVVVYGEILVPAEVTAGSIGFAFKRQDQNDMTVFLMDVYNQPRSDVMNVAGIVNSNGLLIKKDYSFASFPCGSSTCNAASVVGIQSGVAHTFKLFLRLGIFEFYVDEILVQDYYYNYPTFDNCLVGFVGYNLQKAASAYSLSAWEMTGGLSPFPGSTSPQFEQEIITK